MDLSGFPNELIRIMSCNKQCTERNKIVACKYVQLSREIQACNCIKFVAYRTAAKLQVLQKSLGFDKINLRVIHGVLEQHHIRSMDTNLVLSTEEIENILHDIYFAAFREDEKNCIETFIDLSKIVLNEIVSKSRNSSVLSVLILKATLVCICSSSPNIKYHYWFSQLMDHNLHLTRRKFQSLLNALLLIPSYLSESNTFSDMLIDATLDSCFIEDHHTTLGISENHLLAWLSKEPQLLVWLSTLHRLNVSEKVSHSTECSVCGVFPIVGLRYHCLQCIRYDLCQLCFFTSKSSKNHKPRHIIREYCTQQSLYDTAFTFLKDIFKRFCGHSPKLQYLPVNRIYTGKSEAVCVNESLDTNCENRSRMNLDSYNLNEVDSKLRNELQDIIVDIEKESGRLLSNACDLSTKHLISQQIQFLQTYLDKVSALQAELNKKKETENREVMLSCSKNNQHEFKTDNSFDVPVESGFSTWIESVQYETTYTKNLHTDLENIMTKLNNMLESNFSINSDEDL